MTNKPFYQKQFLLLLFHLPGLERTPPYFKYPIIIANNIRNLTGNKTTYSYILCQLSVESQLTTPNQII